MQIQSHLNSTTEQLTQSNITETPRLDAETLLMHALNINRAYLYAHFDDRIPESKLLILNNYLNQRLSGIPIAYILGEKEFWSLNFKVTPAVLIPRPETEHLVEAVLTLLDAQLYLKENNQTSYNILELGTGSGAIAISLAKERPHWKILACDNSESALAVAQDNAKRLLPNYLQSERLKFQYSHWFNQIPEQKFSAIISNPPYIDAQDPHLKALQHEPMSALISGENGLQDIREIIKKSHHYLEPNGILLLEHGNTQAKAVSEIFESFGFTNITTLQDLAACDRITYGMKNSLF